MYQTNFISSSDNKTYKGYEQSTATKLQMRSQLPSEIKCNVGIRQCYSLSPIFFKLVIDRTEAKRKQLPKYKIRNKSILIVCYADNDVLLVASEDDLKRLMDEIVKTAKK